MSSIVYDLSLALPEITIILATLISTLVGAYSTRDAVIFPRIMISMNAAFIALAAFLMLKIPISTTILFEGLYIKSSFSEFAKFMVMLASVLVLMMMTPVDTEDKNFHFEHPIMVMLSLAGMMILVSSNSLITLYMGLELMSLPLYILAASNRASHHSTEAGMKYFILGALASGLFLFGASLVYGFTGEIRFDKIVEFFTVASTESATFSIGFLVGMVFIIVAFCFKISAVPFHMWTPDVYEGSPTVVTAFLASAPKIAAVMLFTWILYAPFAELVDQWKQIVYFVSASSMLVGSLGAIKQTNFKRLLAYSSIGHIGFMLVGLVSGDLDGIRGVVLYLMIYLSMTAGMFAILLMLNRGKRKFEKLVDFAGLSVTHPKTAFAVATLMLSMGGIPPLAGFFAKLYVLLPIISQGYFGLAIILVISSVIAAFYYLRLIKNL